MIKTVMMLLALLFHDRCMDTWSCTSYWMCNNPEFSSGSNLKLVQYGIYHHSCPPYPSIILNIIIKTGKKNSLDLLGSSHCRLPGRLYVRGISALQQWGWYRKEHHHFFVGSGLPGQHHYGSWTDKASDLSAFPERWEGKGERVYQNSGNKQIMSQI